MSQRFPTFLVPDYVPDYKPLSAVCHCKNLCYIRISLFWCFLQGFCSSTTVSLPESLLFVSTLDGNLHAVSKKSGSIKWTLKEGKKPTQGFVIVGHWVYKTLMLSELCINLFHTWLKEK